MTSRGDATRAKLIAATRRVVAERGYPGATTKAIATMAGVSEGTIYRHFPDKVALFFEAAISEDRAVFDELAALPARAGTDTVAENLTRALHRLAELRDQIIPLELAIRADPVLAERRRLAPPPRPQGADPPHAVMRYLMAEQELGRVRADVDPLDATVVLLTVLFGASLLPEALDEIFDRDVVARAVSVVCAGILPHPD
jgi:AcrR family transcriptional regulator